MSVMTRDSWLHVILGHLEARARTMHGMDTTVCLHHRSRFDFTTSIETSNLLHQAPQARPGTRVASQASETCLSQGTQPIAV